MIRCEIKIQNIKFYNEVVNSNADKIEGLRQSLTFLADKNNYPATRWRTNFIKNNYSKIENDIATKQNHGLAMKDSVLELTKKSGMFNETYNESGKIEGCFHDIGRFKQYLDTKTLNDSKLKLYNCNDHGQLGKMILLENIILRKNSFMKIINKLRLPYYLVLGNHDVFKGKDLSKEQYNERTP